MKEEEARHEWPSCYFLSLLTLHGVGCVIDNDEGTKNANVGDVVDNHSKTMAPAVLGSNPREEDAFSQLFWTTCMHRFHSSNKRHQFGPRHHHRRPLEVLLQ